LSLEVLQSHIERMREGRAKPSVNLASLSALGYTGPHMAIGPDDYPLLKQIPEEAREGVSGKL
jgi:hypothetical protein